MNLAKQMSLLSYHAGVDHNPAIQQLNLSAAGTSLRKRVFRADNDGSGEQKEKAHPVHFSVDMQGKIVLPTKETMTDALSKGSRLELAKSFMQT
jgi:hypothetical protein